MSQMARAFMTCIVCAALAVQEFLDLGETALANKFLTQQELSLSEDKYPLKIGFCHDCGHVQLTSIVPPGAMFEDYLYVSSASDTLKAHLHELAGIVVERHRLAATNLVIDIGCNDGTLLEGFARHGVRTLGVDPAKNLAQFPERDPIDRYVGFFNSETAREIARTRGTASIITATNTFPHIPDLQDFLAGIRTALAPGGTFVIEAHYLVDMLDQVAFDTIYHEHVSYWALGPMMRLFERNGLQAVHAERVPVHHGQLRVSVQRSDEGTPHPSVAAILESERAAGLDRYDTFERFAEQTLRIKQDLHRTITELRAQGKRIAGYGAPAKGNTLLGFLEIGPDLVDFIADRSPLKQGRYTPGMHIPVVAPERLMTDQPDYVILFAWNFADEILQQQAEYRARGGRFIIPVPEVRLIEPGAGGADSRA
jgi:SAM-dependent methyltransferase